MEDRIHAGGLFDNGTLGSDNLFAGDANEANVIAYKGVLLEGQNLTRGALLGAITTGGKLVLSLSASADGSQTPSGVLLHDADATDGDVEVMYAKSGCFNSSALTIGTGHTVASIRAGLEDRGIYLRP